MLNTVIDYSIFEHFTKSQTAQIPIGSEEDNEYWNSFWKFLKLGSNVILTNYGKQQNIFLNTLTTGRKGTTIKIEDTFKKPHKCKFPKNQDIQTVFFLDEQSDSEKVKYRKNNGFLFGFLNDYKEVWNKISFLNNETVLHDRKSAIDVKKFTWDKFSELLLPFTDVILRDDFLFKDINEIENRFGNIIKALDKASIQKYNLLIILNKYKLDQGFDKNIDNLYQYLKNEKLINPNKVNIGFVHTAKEHDRYTFFNYLEVGFGKIPDSSNKPTKITFNPYVLNDNYLDAKIVLDDLENIVGNAKKNGEFIGNIENRLLGFE